MKILKHFRSPSVLFAAKNGWHGSGNSLLVLGNPELSSLDSSSSMDSSSRSGLVSGAGSGSGLVSGPGSGSGSSWS